MANPLAFSLSLILQGVSPQPGATQSPQAGEIVELPHYSEERSPEQKKKDAKSRLKEQRRREKKEQRQHLSRRPGLWVIPTTVGLGLMGVSYGMAVILGSVEIDPLLSTPENPERQRRHAVTVATPILGPFLAPKASAPSQDRASELMLGAGQTIGLVVGGVSWGIYEHKLSEWREELYSPHLDRFSWAKRIRQSQKRKAYKMASIGYGVFAGGLVISWLAAVTARGFNPDHPGVLSTSERYQSHEDRKDRLNRYASWIGVPVFGPLVALQASSNGEELLGAALSWSAQIGGLAVGSVGLYRYLHQKRLMKHGPGKRRMKMDGLSFSAENGLLMVGASGRF